MVAQIVGAGDASTEVPSGDTAPASETIVDATEENFDTVVVARSHQTPVLVDIGADWCSPCRVLGPLLHRLAARYDGRFVLATVDADENMRIAGRHKVRGFPTVIAYSHGVEIDRFHSAQTEHGHAALLAPTPMVTPEGK